MAHPHDGSSIDLEKALVRYMVERKAGTGRWPEVRTKLRALPIEIVSHLARPLSLSLRLFGNITGDHAVVGGFMALAFVGWAIPSVFMGLGVFVSFMQAFIFTVLSMIYISGAVAHEEEH